MLPCYTSIDDNTKFDISRGALKGVTNNTITILPPFMEFVKIVNILKNFFF